ncbi:MAG: lysostaphin resistance A-like protein [Terracidiphilus sp.]
MSELPEYDANHSESSGTPDEQHVPSSEPPARDPDPAEIAPTGIAAPDPPSDPPPDPLSDPLSDLWLTPPAPGPYLPPAFEPRGTFDPSYPGPVSSLFTPRPFARRPPRIPHLGHLLLLCLFFICGWVCIGLLGRYALHAHWFGVSSLDQAKTNIGFLLGSEAVLYLISFGISFFAFPLFWRKGFFQGVHWNVAAALGRYRLLLGAAFVCFLLAMLSGYFMPGPTNAPIDKIFRAPGAAWCLFAFGVTFAPFFEELVFRGFLLPALCTSFDWLAEQIRHVPPRPLDGSGHPQWSFGAMVFAAIATSIPFALMHAAQTGYSLGPFILLVFVSLVLCWARLNYRSLAASVLIHASYNFMIFTVMMLGSGGFRHLQNM